MITATTVSGKLVKPQECVIGFGIPTCKAAFLHDIQQDNKDFARQYNGIYRRFELEFLHYFNKIVPIYRQLGVQIIENLTLGQFAGLFRDEKLSVIILFSHWLDDENRIEFSDGLIGIPKVVGQIPVAYSGFLDLSICHPEQLTIELRKNRPRCLFRYALKKITPSFWLYFYLELFYFLAKNDCSYPEALEKRIIQFIKTRGLKDETP